MQNGFTDELPIDELACDLADLGPGSFHADGWSELALGNQIRQVLQTR
jgi:hypothetical protein